MVKKKINGNISNIKEGAFIIDKYTEKQISVLYFSENFIYSNILIITTTQKKIELTTIKFFIKTEKIYL